MQSVSTVLLCCVLLGCVTADVYLRKTPWSRLIRLPGRLPSDFQQVYYPPNGGPPQVYYPQNGGPRYYVYPPPPANPLDDVNVYYPEKSEKRGYIIYPAYSPDQNDNNYGDAPNNY